MWSFLVLFHSALAQQPIEYLTQFEVEKPIVVSQTVPVCRDAYEAAAARKEKWSPGLLVISSFKKNSITKNRILLINGAKQGQEAARGLGELKTHLEDATSNHETPTLKVFVKKIASQYYKKSLKKSPPKKQASEERVIRLLLKNGYESGKFCPDVKNKKTGELKRSVKTQTAVVRDVIKEIPKALRKISGKPNPKKKKT